MPTGEHPRRGRPCRAPRPRGFSYLLLLFSLVLAGVAAAHTGQHWVQTGQREREAELAWRARQIAQALTLYATHTPAGQPAWPLDLAELLEDRRQQPPQRWLRQLYTDPFTGTADWQLQRDSDGRVRGLASRSRQQARGPLPAGAALQDPAGGTATVGDWWFSAAMPAAVPQAPSLEAPAPAEPPPPEDPVADTDSAIDTPPPEPRP